MFSKLLALTVVAFATAMPTAPTQNLVELAASVPALSTLVVAVKAAGLVDTLESPGPFTVLAPTNDAFAALPAGVLQKLLQPENKAALVEILTYHVASGNVQAGDLTNGMKIKTVEGSNVTAYVRGSEVTFEGGAKGDIAKVVQANAEATNGVAHVIDAILIPPATMQQLVGDMKNIVELAESVPTLSTLVVAVKAAGLVDTLEGKGPFTVFAPTNAAFAALPAGVLQKLLQPENKAELAAILTYHVVAGNVTAGELKNDEKIKTVEGSDIAVFLKNKDVIIEGGTKGDYARVIQANVFASNGVVHVLDHVLLPPHHPHPGPAPGPANRTIVELAASNPELSTLVTALKAAGLVSTLSSKGPFTVFAPTNQAFEDLPAGVLHKLLEPENKAELVKILTYHVASGNLQAKDLKNEELIKTVEGEDVEILIRDDEGFVRGKAHDNYAKILRVDDEASNGVVHVIDHVLLPAENNGYVSAL